jgi:hypothetical protein
VQRSQVFPFCVLELRQASTNSEPDTCNYRNCREKRTMADRPGHACERHVCFVDMCPRTAQSFTSYCSQHSCSYDSCNLARGDGEMYCSRHGCRYRDCRLSSRHGHEYCVEHADRDVRRRLKGRESLVFEKRRHRYDVSFRDDDSVYSDSYFRRKKVSELMDWMFRVR